MQCVMRREERKGEYMMGRKGRLGRGRKGKLEMIRAGSLKRPRDKKEERKGEER